MQLSRTYCWVAGNLDLCKVAETWEWDYEERLVGAKALIAASTTEIPRPSSQAHSTALARYANSPDCPLSLTGFNQIHGTTFG